MTFTIRPAVREKIGLLFAIGGPSGSGKTLSALLIATGIANGTGKIGVVDTEAGRALHYAPQPGEKADPSKGTFDFLHLDFPPPYTPERYVDAIKEIEAAGATVIVVDSTSHEWEGEGGCTDMFETAQERMARSAAERSGGNWELMLEKFVAPAWKQPKRRHIRMMNRLIHSRSHLIFCLRARDKIKINGGKVIPLGFMPICEKSFMFEMSGSMVLHPETPGAPDYNMSHKLNATLQAIFPDGERIGIDAGKRLRVWAETGAERPAIDKAGMMARDLIERFQDAPDKAGIDALKADAKVIEQLAWLAAKRPELAVRVDVAVGDATALFEAVDEGDAP